MSKTETLFNLKQKKRLEKLKKGFFLHPQRIWSNWENRVSAETRFAAEQIYFAIILSKDIVHKMQLYLHWAALIGREMQKLSVWSLITNYRITIQTKMQMKHYFPALIQINAMQKYTWRYNKEKKVNKVLFVL